LCNAILKIREKLVYLPAVVNGKSHLCLCDTGCDRSLMPLKMINKDEIQPMECRLYAANGTIIEVLWSGKAKL